jgi:Rhodopirellula transposase DDE domain
LSRTTIRAVLEKLRGGASPEDVLAVVPAADDHRSSTPVPGIVSALEALVDSAWACVWITRSMIGVETPRWQGARTAHTPVRIHDFLDPTLGKAIPYGIYGPARNDAWVNVGIDHDTPESAVRSIAQWWKQMGRRAYPGATELLITTLLPTAAAATARAADSGRRQLQDFADRRG